MDKIIKIKTITNAMVVFDLVSITEKLVMFGSIKATMLNTLISKMNVIVCIKWYFFIL